MARPEDDADDPPEPPRLRQLRWLVNALMLTLIAGVITIVVLLVIRLGPFQPDPGLPPQVSVPEGEAVQAVTLGSDWVAVVTRDGAGRERVRVLDRLTGAERGTMEIVPGE
jgi:hypothetical protein